MGSKMTHAAATILVLQWVALVALQQPAAQTSQAAAIEEIVVTAQNRGQSIEDVPLSITALSGEELRDSMTFDAKDLVLTTPGLAGYGLDSCICTMSVRGISVNNYGLGGDPSIGLFKNGVYSGTTGEALTNFYDIERVEVLRGPQGLLFGRAAIAGAMHVVTRRPSLDSEVSGSLGAGGGERGQFRMDGAINIPVSDTLAFRLAGFHQEQDGWINNVVPGQPDAGASNYDGFRASALYEDGPLSVFVMGEYDDRTGPPTIYVPIGASLSEPLSGNIRETESDLDGSVDRDASEVLNFIAEINYEFDSGTLTSLTGFRTHDWFYGGNSDASALPYIHAGGDQEGEYFSQELRFVSSDDRSVRWFVGVSGFFSQLEADQFSTGAEEMFCLFNLGTDCTSFAADLGLPWSPSSDGAYRETALVENESAGVSVYADVTIDLSDAARLSLGFRYSYEERDFTVEYPEWTTSLIDDYFALSYYVASGRTTEPVKSSENWSNFSPRALIEYDLGTDALIYASVTNGFKPGGFNNFGLENPIGGIDTPLRLVSLYLADLGFIPPEFVPPPIYLYDSTSSVGSFGEETVWSYEVGIKGRFLDGGGRYSLSAFYYDYKDLQILSFGLAGAIVDNVGKAEGLGLEFEVSAALNEYLMANLGISWSKSEVGGMENNLDSCAEVDYSNCNGNRLAFHPEFTASASLMARIPVGAVEWFGVAELAYQDNIFTQPDNNPQFEADAWTVVNFRVGADIGEQWQVSAYVENVFDEELLYYGWDQYFVQIGADPSLPQTIGFDVRYRF